MLTNALLIWIIGLLSAILIMIISIAKNIVDLKNGD